MLAAVLALISLPAVLAATEAVSFYARNRSNGFLVSSGQQREYLLHVPKSYDRKRPTPLVISMHGAGGWPAQLRDLSRWNALAESQGFIVVYPSGADWVGPRIWHVERGPGLLRDVRFISALIDTLEAGYNIDPARIYANGFSNGGGMAFALSCTLSDRIAAVGTVASAPLLPWSWCTDSRPVPMITFHGTADRFIPYNGGSSPIATGPFRASRPGRRIGPEETCADRTPSKLWSLRMSPASNTRTALTMQPWCSTPSGEEATPGLAASRCRNQ